MEKENFIIEKIQANNILYPSYFICVSYEHKNKKNTDGFILFRNNSDFILDAFTIELELNFSQDERDNMRNENISFPDVKEYIEENVFNIAVSELMNRYEDFLFNFNKNLSQNNYISTVEKKPIEKKDFKILGISDKKLNDKLKIIYEKSNCDELKEYIKTIINFPRIYKISAL